MSYANRIHKVQFCEIYEGSFTVVSPSLNAAERRIINILYPILDQIAYIDMHYTSDVNLYMHTYDNAARVYKYLAKQHHAVENPRKSICVNKVYVIIWHKAKYSI